MLLRLTHLKALRGHQCKGYTQGVADAHDYPKVRLRGQNLIFVIVLRLPFGHLSLL